MTVTEKTLLPDSAGSEFSAEYALLTEQMIATFNHNTLRGTSVLYGNPMLYEFIAPSLKEYVYQWLWDTAVHAIALAEVDPERAQRELIGHLKAQQDDGFVPHIIFWDQSKPRPFWAETESKWETPEVSALTQPPLLAVAVERVYNKTSDENSKKEFLDATIDKLYDYHKWFQVQRDPDGNGLVSIISANESGMDELPNFKKAFVDPSVEIDPDELERQYRAVDVANAAVNFDPKHIFDGGHFNVECASFNAIYHMANESLVRLLRQRGTPEDLARATEVEGWIQRTRDALIAECYDAEDGFFYSLSATENHEKKMLKVKTIDGLIPLLIKDLPEDITTAVIDGHLLNEAEFARPYPIPTVAANETEYYVPDPGEEINIEGKGLLWRGPSWVITSWLVFEGLLSHAHTGNPAVDQKRMEVARTILQMNIEMVKKESREFYSPETGKGYRVGNFGMNYLVLEMIRIYNEAVTRSPRVYSSQS
jgi:hypothetical protein